jgi:hypothetical protein
VTSGRAAFIRVCEPFWTSPFSEYTLPRSSGIEFSGFKKNERAKRREIMQRKASAVWQGGLKDGKGSISTDSGVLKQTQYSYSTRFENGVGTNPEELLAAAHAG